VSNIAESDFVSAKSIKKILAKNGLVLASLSRKL